MVTKRVKSNPKAPADIPAFDVGDKVYYKRGPGKKASEAVVRDRRWDMAKKCWIYDTEPIDDDMGDTLSEQSIMDYHKSLAPRFKPGHRIRAKSMDTSGTIDHVSHWDQNDTPVYEVKADGADVPLHVPQEDLEPERIRPEPVKRGKDGLTAGERDIAEHSIMTRVGDKGRVTIPETFREQHHIEKNDVLILQLTRVSKPEAINREAKRRRRMRV